MMIEIKKTLICDGMSYYTDDDYDEFEVGDTVTIRIKYDSSGLDGEIIEIHDKTLIIADEEDIKHEIKISNIKYIDRY